MAPSNLDAALAYLAAGYSVIPITPGEKAPSLVDWKPYQSRKPTPEEVSQWWGATPTANIAIITGAISNLTAVDVDGARGMESYKANLLGMPMTRSHKTPKGYHLLYKHCPQLKTGAAFLPGIDVRSDGGYIVAPPSIVNGAEYAVQRDSEVVYIGEVPTALYQHSIAKPQNGNGASEAPGWVADLLQHGAPEHSRNSSAIRLAGYFHSKGHPPDVIAAMMDGFARRCSPPMEQRELEGVIASAQRYPVKPPTVSIDDPPEFTDLGDRYLFSWPQHHLELSLASMSRDHDAVRAWLTLYRIDDDGVKHYAYGPISYNLVGQMDRSGVLKHLKEYKGLNAAEMLQNVSRIAIEALIAGTPAQYLADVEPRTSNRWLLHPLVLADHPNVWFADGGVGKSLLALTAMLSIHSGVDFGLGVPQTLARGMYLDWEFDPADHRERMLLLAQGDPALEGITTMYKRCVAPVWEMVDELLRDITDHNIGFIVVDSALLAAGGEPEKADTCRRYFQALRRLGVTTLTITHTTKDSEGRKPFGSNYWHHMARNIWMLSKEAEGDTMHLTLENTKGSTSRLQRPYGLSVQWHEDRIVIASEELRDNAVIPLHTRIDGLLAHYPTMTVAEIASELGEKENHVTSALFQRKGTMFNKLGEKWSRATHYDEDTYRNF